MKGASAEAERRKNRADRPFCDRETFADSPGRDIACGVLELIAQEVFPGRQRGGQADLRLAVYARFTGEAEGVDRVSSACIVDITQREPEFPKAPIPRITSE